MKTRYENWYENGVWFQTVFIPPDSDPHPYGLEPFVLCPQGAIVPTTEEIKKGPARPPVPARPPAPGGRGGRGGVGEGGREN